MQRASKMNKLKPDMTCYMGSPHACRRCDRETAGTQYAIVRANAAPNFGVNRPFNRGRLSILFCINPGQSLGVARPPNCSIRSRSSRMVSSRSALSANPARTERQGLHQPALSSMRCGRCGGARQEPDEVRGPRQGRAPFGVIKRVFGFAKVRYRGLAKNTQRAWVSCGLANLFMVRRRLVRT